MKYFSLTVPVLTSSIKNFGRFLLPLPFCIVLISCDSQSSTTAATHNATMKQSMTDSKVRNNNEDDSAQINDESVALADDVTSEGESLIAAAKPDDSVQSSRSPMFSDASASDELQATLIGDYVGILPCSFCDSVEVMLNLFADGSVVKTSIYENPETPRVPLVERGIYRQDNKIITIVYENGSLENYTIQDSLLVMMNDDKTLNADSTLSRK